MRRGPGIVPTVTGILLLATVSGRPASRALPAGAGSETGRTAVTASQSTKELQSDSARWMSGSSLLADFFGATNLHEAQCDSAYSIATSIVMLPDPDDSHLDWAYDSGLESVFRALERDGFVIDRFWLPWNSVADIARSTLLQGKPVRAMHPGILLFRGSDPAARRLHMVFVVGETPTGGAHKLALKNALSETDTIVATAGSCFPAPDSLAAKPRPTRIVGPAFSGSVTSLALTLNEWRRTHADTTSHPVQIVSGSASNIGNRKSLMQVPGVTFSATVNPDSSLQWFIDEVLVGRMRIAPQHIAILSEATTQFGERAHSDSDTSIGHYRSAAADVLSIRFPISISSLRSEYAKHPAEPTPSDQAIGHEPAPRVPVSLVDTTVPAEHPAVRSDLTNPANDQAIDEIARTLITHHTETVGIVATDVRDQLFLARELKVRVPDVQVFVLGANLLLVRPEEAEHLVGTLVLTSYPLLLENQFWDVTQSTNQRQIFTSDLAQGIYNAMLVQLGDTNALSEYNQPIVGRMSAPPVWITAVGRGGYYPVAISGDVGANADSYLVHRTPRGPLRERPEYALQWWELAGLLLLLIVGGPAFYAGMHSRASRRVPPTVPPTEDDSGVTAFQRVRVQRFYALMRQRETYVALRYLAFCGAMFCAGLILLRVSSHGDLRYTNMVVVLCALPLLLAGVFIVARRGRRQWRMVGSREREARPIAPTAWGEASRVKIDKIGLYLFYLVGLLYLVTFVLFVLSILELDQSNSALFFMRAVHVGSGVSPLAPLFLGAIGFGCWTSWHLTRVTQLARPTVFDEACASEVFEVNDRHRRAPNQNRGAGDTMGYPLCYGFTYLPTAIPDPTGANPSTPWVLRLDDFLDHMHDRPADAGGLGVIVQNLRSRLSYLVPTSNAALTLLTLIVVAVWVSIDISTPIDAAVLQASRFPVPPAAGAFGALLRFTFISAICGTVWSLWRFVSTWGQLAALLERLEDSPLADAFSRLPRSLVRSTRIALFDSPALVSVASALEERWPLLVAATEAPALRSDASIASSIANSNVPSIRGDLYSIQPDFETPFVHLYKALCLEWRLAHRRRLAADEKAIVDSEHQPRLHFIDAAEDVVAIFVVDYIEWVFRSLRSLAFFLVFALILMIGLLASYPIQPTSVIEAIYFLVIGATVVSIVTILFRMNREPILSRLAGTTAGEVNWDTHFITNIAIFGALPLLTLVGSQFPAARSFLFSWVAPILRAVGKG
jgi:hypothetical protein